MDTETQMTLVEAIAELNRRKQRIKELEPDAKAYRKLCDIRNRHPGIPCACEFSDDHSDTVLGWCEFHKELRERIAELEMQNATLRDYIVVLTKRNIHETQRQASHVRRPTREADYLGEQTTGDEGTNGLGVRPPRHR